jgi:hypothetical protein
MSWNSTKAGSAASLQRSSCRTLTRRAGRCVHPSTSHRRSSRSATRGRRRGSGCGTRTGCRPTCAVQRYRRQEAATPGMPVRAYFRLPVHRQKVEPVPQWRQRGARPRPASPVIQGRCQGNDRGRADSILKALCTPDPRAQFGMSNAHLLSHQTAPAEAPVGVEFDATAIPGKCNVWND